MKTSAQRAFAIAAAFASSIGLTASALAHHGWGWTEAEESRLTGTIEEISFTNPHMHVKLRNDAGLWAVDLSPPSIAQRSGFGPDAAKAGDRAIMTGHRASDRERLAFKAETITVGGKTYDVYPQRPKSLKPAG